MIKEQQLNDDFVYNNEEEAEMGQLHAIHNNMNAIANVRRQLEQQAAQPSLTHCEECGDEIPKKRQELVLGVKLCVYCQQLQERSKGR
jgi:phage/conjugal plasmid C-4 type zinc finger TraR family protein